MKIVFFFLFILLGLQSNAQGDGPRNFILAPKGVWGVAASWINLNQNLLPAGNFLVSDADINATIYPTTLFHTFGIKGRYAQVLAMVNPGSASGRIGDAPPLLPGNELSTNGFSDGFVGFNLGLINAPALDVAEYSKHEHAFAMYGFFRLWYSGTYDRNELLNLGTNRLTFEIGTPMTIALNKNPKRATWLEVFPNVLLFTDNNAPSRSAMAEKTKQKPLLIVENHLTHNLNSKFWAGIDLRYQYGGQTESDGVEDDNRINILGAGLGVGYQFFPFLSGKASYGKILIGDNEARSEMMRVTLIFNYVNMNKLK